MSGRWWLVRCYPPGWRERYGDDLATYLDDTYPGRLPLRAAASLLTGGLRERLRGSRMLGTAPPTGDRVRGGVLVVLAAWAVFVVAGASFAKLSEHFDTPLSDRTRTIPDLAYTALQGIATLSGLAVVAGIAMATPALVRFVSRGGWAQVRRHVLRAAVVTAPTAASTVAVVLWAHQLTAAQRNGGSPGYGAAFLAWAALAVVTVGLWTVAAVSTARRLTLSRPVLLVEGALAVTATAGMLLMVAAASAWWAAMASSAPSFLSGGAPGPTSPWNPQLVATLALMLTALAVASTGAVRIIRAARSLLTPNV